MQQTSSSNTTLGATPLVSIVLPTYNHASLLSSAIQSVLAQDYPHLELVIVNDGSTDTTEEVIATFSSDPRMRYFSQKNAGIAAALNRGFQEARGSFFSWTSADNRYLPQAISRLLHFLQLHPRIDLVYANCQLIDEHGDALQNSSYRAIDQDPNDRSILKLPTESQSLAAFNDNFINACFLYRRSLAARIGKYRSDLLGFEDYEFWLRASLTGRIAHLGQSEPLYQYRLHQNSLTEQLKKANLSAQQEPFVARILRLEKELARFPKVQHSIRNAEIQHCFVQSCSQPLWRRTSKTLQLEVPTLTDSVVLNVDQRIAPEEEMCSLPSLLWRDWFGYLELSTPSTLHTEVWPCFTPLYSSKLLLRARSTDFSSIEPEADSRGIGLLIQPTVTQNAALLKQLASRIERDQLTYVLFCETPAQRAFADSLVLNSAEPRWLRIIDVCGKSENPLDAQGKLASLLYCLSSVDLCLFPLNFLDNPCAIHLAATCSASAAKPLLLCADFTENSEERGRSGQLAKLQAYLHNAPHCYLIENTAEISDELLKKDLSFSSLDAWLSLNNSTDFHRKITGMACAQHEFTP